MCCGCIFSKCYLSFAGLIEPLESTLLQSTHCGFSSLCIMTDAKPNWIYDSSYFRLLALMSLLLVTKRNAKSTQKTVLVYKYLAAHLILLHQVSLCLKLVAHINRSYKVTNCFMFSFYEQLTSNIPNYCLSNNRTPGLVASLYSAQPTEAALSFGGQIAGMYFNNMLLQSLPTVCSRI